MDDTISRQDAIMAVKTGALSAATIYGRTDAGSTALYETVRAIKALPSAHPECTRECMPMYADVSDYISRQDAIDALGDMVMNWTDSDYELGQLNQWKADRKAIIDLPSAQPEIVRCKDCRFYEWMSNRVPEEQTWYCHNWNAETGKDDYCSYAERRE